MHADRMTEFNDAIEQFFLTLDPRWATRVTVMTFSEFGRTSFKNDGNGTDHGTANCAFVLGANVKGGTYGQHPNLAGLNRWDRVGYTVDFRSYYTSILDGWLGGGASSVLGGAYENLGLFALPPGPGLGDDTDRRWRWRSRRCPDTSCRSARPGSPTRATAPAASPCAGSDASELLTVTIAGRGGVPSTGAIAVIANVTAVDVTEPTFLTVCPGGAARPETSNLNPVPGRATPNLVVMGTRRGRHDRRPQQRRRDQLHRRRLRLLRRRRRRPAASARAESPARHPQRGRHAAPARVARRQRIDLQVTGHGGVPSSGVSAVVLNVTVDQPASDGFLSVGPAGEAIPRDVEPQLRGRSDRPEPRGLQGRRRRDGELQRRVRLGPPASPTCSDTSRSRRFEGPHRPARPAARHP